MGERLNIYSYSFRWLFLRYTAQKVKFSNKDFSCKYDQIHSFVLIWSYLMKKSLMKKLIFCEVIFSEVFANKNLCV